MASSCSLTRVKAAKIDQAEMVIEDDPDLLVSEDEKITTTQQSRGTAYSADSTSEEDKPISRILNRNRFSSESRAGRFDDSRLSLSDTEECGSYHVPPDARPGTKRKREATPERVESLAPTKTLSIFDVKCTPSPPYKVKLGRDRLLDVEHAPNRLKTVSQQNQRSAPFLRLPWDIKLKIYKLAIGGQHIHIDYKPHIHTWRQKNKQRFKEYIPGGLHCEVNDESGSEDDDVMFLRIRLGLPVISMTCRQIYHDTALLYYSLNKFSFNNKWVMTKWMKSLAPVQRRAITRLVIPHPCDVPKYILNDLKGLKKVYLTFPCNPSTTDTVWMKQVSELWEGRGISVINYPDQKGRASFEIEVRCRFR